MKLTRRGRVALLMPTGALVFGCGVALPVSSDPFACPSGAHLTWYEDGSGACYPDVPDYGVRDQYPLQRVDGSDWSWPEDTFGPWDCETMGNRVCGPVWTEWGTYDGHPDCQALIGDTTLVRCADGWEGTT